MSGHSKWSTIHRKKGEIDANRGKVFQKLAKEIYVVAKSSSKDLDTNPALRAVIEKAKGQNMPKDNIQKALDKAWGLNQTEDYETVVYEGYGPKGIAIMIECLTDNKNRTAGMVRSTLTKRNGNLGTDGSVAYLFERKGVIVIPDDYDEDKVLNVALEEEALDFIKNEGNYEIYTKPEDFLKIKEEFEKNQITDFIASEVTFVASNYIALEGEDKEKVFDLISALEEIDDVNNVYHNLEG